MSKMATSHLAPPEQLIHVTVFPAPEAGSSARIHHGLHGQYAKEFLITWNELPGYLAGMEYASKGDSPLLKLARFGNLRSRAGSLRNNANVLDISGIEGDYDAGQVAMEEAARNIKSAGLAAILYTTPSSTPERPRWRVLVPLSCLHKAEQHRGLVAKLNGILGGILAKESFTLSQAYYFGKVAGAENRMIVLEGQPLDLVGLTTGEIYPEGGGSAEHMDPPSNAGLSLERDFALARVNNETLADLKKALGRNPHTDKPWIDPDNRVTWIAVGQDLKCLGDDGKDLWLEWSAHSEKFDDGVEDPLRVWHSLSGTKADYRAVFTKAQAGGWVNLGKANHRNSSVDASTRDDLTDAGNVAILARFASGDLRYIHEMDRWMYWNGNCWTWDAHGVVVQQAALQVAERHIQRVSELRQELATGNGNLDYLRNEIKKLTSWIGKCRSTSGISNMIKLAKADSRFVLSASELDQNPYLLGVANGVVDLRVGTLCEASRDEYVTKRSPVAYTPSAQAPRWERFIMEITAIPQAAEGWQERPELANYLKKALGYSLTGSTGEHKMFVAVGEGSNGKSVLFDTLKQVMGDYCAPILADVLMATRFDADPERATPFLRRLEGVRSAICSESKDGQSLNGTLVKRLTGDGYITARGLHEQAHTFKPSHKIWLMTNHKPSLDHLDEAVRGRLHIIPFDMRWNRPGHPDPDPRLPHGDKSLTEALKAEVEGILTWLVAGAVKYCHEGLEPSEEVVSMTRTYFSDQDALGQWLDGCERCDVADGETASVLFHNFESWCSGEGQSPGSASSKKTFGQLLVKRGVEKRRTSNGSRYSLRLAGERFRDVSLE